MRDIRDWVIEESAKLGYDFNSLPQNKQNMILSSIMAGLENGFRSRCNYPDLRFAKLKSINFSEDKNVSNNLVDNTCSTIFSDDKCGFSSKECGDTSSCGDMCTNEDTRGCTNGMQTCTNNECTNDECTNNGGEGYSCHDNSCSNSGGCTDNDKCFDNDCSNRGNYSSCTDTLHCLDEEGCSNTASECTDSDYCTDSGCSNSGGSLQHSGGCVDSDNCTDNESCVNNKIHLDCIDYNNCSDNECDNRNSFGEYCIDNDACRDDKCCNRLCGDIGAQAQESCGDDMCSNGRICNDQTCVDTSEGGGSNGCGDQGCINSASEPFAGGCTDMETHCVDNSCTNFITCDDNAGIDCVDQPCSFESNP